MSEEKGFSYESPEKQRKRGGALLITEFILGGIIVAFSFLILNYFNLFPVSRIFPNQLGWLPAQKSFEINVVSKISGYEVSIVNKDKLLKLLNSWGLFDKNYDVKFGAEGSTNGKPLKKLNIQLVDKELPTTKFFTKEREVYTSAYTYISEGQFDTQIHLNIPLLEASFSDANPGRAMQTTLLVSLFRIVNPGKSQEESAKYLQQAFDNFKTDPLTTMEYFKVVKK